MDISKVKAVMLIHDKGTTQGVPNMSIDDKGQLIMSSNRFKVETYSKYQFPEPQQKNFEDLINEVLEKADAFKKNNTMIKFLTDYETLNEIKE